MRWLYRLNKTLFCPGIPGASKTIIVVIVIDLCRYYITKRKNIGRKVQLYIIII